MQHRVDTKVVEDFDESSWRNGTFVELCVLQLKLALDESRLEMDGLAAEMIGVNNSPSVELITRLQSVDRLMQRLTNVHSNLDRYTRFLQNSGSTTEDSAWETLLEQTRETFTMEQERKIFDSMLTDFEKNNA